MKKVYLINEYDRYCPENNNGELITKVFSNLELAKEYCLKHDPPSSKPFGRKGTGLSIIEFELDEEE